MNSQWHDEFIALCALFASGELTEEEWALLQVHLAYCESCRAAFDEYQQISRDVIPMMAAAASEEDETSRPNSPSHAEAERKLMEYLEAEPNKGIASSAKKIGWRFPSALLAASILGVVALFALHSHHFRSNTPEPQRIAVIPKRQVLPAIPVKTSDGTAEALTQSHRELTKLEGELQALRERYRQSGANTVNLEAELAAVQEEAKQLTATRDSLNLQLMATQAELKSLQQKSTATTLLTAEQTQRASDLEGQVHTLNTALEEKDRMLALDKQFLDHDREIRDLIAARNLYIADIYDVAQNGKTDKPFGRIFYTKDKSLVFYGYDLDKQSGLREPVAFQAWGSGDDQHNVSLGIFYQDDHQNRWVLRFNDKKTLARLNMVFVTAEPQGGSPKPTGKPLLLAYLQVKPNHP